MRANCRARAPPVPPVAPALVPGRRPLRAPRQQSAAWLWSAFEPRRCAVVEKSLAQDAVALPDLQRDLFQARHKPLMADAVERPPDRDIVAVDQDDFRRMGVHPPDPAQRPLFMCHQDVATAARLVAILLHGRVFMIEICDRPDVVAGDDHRDEFHDACAVWHFAYGMRTVGTLTVGTRTVGTLTVGTRTVGVFTVTTRTVGV